MGALNSERIHEPCGVPRHVEQGVGHVELETDGGLGHQRHGVGHAGCIQSRRPADVAIVEPDNVQAAPGQGQAEILVPADHLRAKAHDQHERGIACVTERVATERHAIAGDHASLGSCNAHG
jgi:hypothetical protein